MTISSKDNTQLFSLALSGNNMAASSTGNKDKKQDERVSEEEFLQAQFVAVQALKASNDVAPGKIKRSKNFNLTQGQI